VRTWAIGAAGTVVLATFLACGSSRGGYEATETNPTEPDAGTNAPRGSSGSFGKDGVDGSLPADPDKCVGLACQQRACDGGKSTTLNGTVYDPAGKNPLYNVVVYVPNAAVQPLKQGASCDACDALYTGSPLVSTVTDAQGKFSLPNMPDGKDIPLVVQVGKWRRQLTVPNVAACADTTLPDKSVTLPKNHDQGDMPNIAVSSGGLDSLECLFRRIGIDASEYGGGPNGKGRIHVFRGGSEDASAHNTSPPGPTSYGGLWTSKSELMKYDVVFLSCEGDETEQMNQQAMFDYAAAGGRVYASHFHYAWFNTGPFASGNLATWKTGSNDIDDLDARIVTKLADNSPFIKGVALKAWLGQVSALNAKGELPIRGAKHNADVGVANKASQVWIEANDQADPPRITQYFTFNTPLGAPADKQCGRVVYSDLHVGDGSGDFEHDDVIPNGCGTDDLTPQEKALEFMLFDLTSCVSPDNKPPPPPPVPVHGPN
jgi:hypothetical protein